MHGRITTWSTGRRPQCWTIAEDRSCWWRRPCTSSSLCLVYLAGAGIHKPCPLLREETWETMPPVQCSTHDFACALASFPKVIFSLCKLPYSEFISREKIFTNGSTGDMIYHTGLLPSFPSRSHLSIPSVSSMTPSEERFNQDGGLEVPDWWTALYQNAHAWFRAPEDTCTVHRWTFP